MDKVTVGDVVWVYDAKLHTCLKERVFSNIHCYQKAILRNISYNVKSTFDDYIYPVLYDVHFLHNGRIGKGHFEVIPCIEQGYLGA